MAQRSASSNRRVPFLPNRQIELEAEILLAEYGQAHGLVTEPPVPVDEIIKLHLGLAFDLKDMRQLFGGGDVHGALWVKDKIVGVDQSLDPSIYPNMLGRFHFTLGHETGHWRLHRQFYLQNVSQKLLFEETPTMPAYVCRSSDAKKPVEWQADFFAACLLMPRPLVFAAWEDWRGDLEPVFLDDLRASEGEILESELLRRGGLVMDRESTDRTLMEGFGRPLAERFEVSAEAMRIRLEEMGRLQRKRENALF